MRKSGALVVLSVVFLTGCGPGAGKAERPQLPRNSTGFFKTPELDYVSNDPYVQKRLAEETPDEAPTQQDTGATPTPVTPQTPETAQPEKPGTPSTAKPAAPKKTSSPAPGESLQSRVRQFEISRFDAADAKKAVRFGESTYELIVFFKDGSAEKFAGKLTKTGNGVELKQVNPRYQLSGLLADDRKTDKTVGLFKLFDGKTGQTIEISYRAYLKGITVRRDLSEDIAGSEIEQQLKSLCGDIKETVNHCKNTFSWVNNWSVVVGPGQAGPSFYLYDFVVFQSPGTQEAEYVPPVVSISGESLRTGGENNVYEHKAETNKGGLLKDVTLLGNGEDGARMFEAKVTDDKSKKTSTVLIDIDGEDEKPASTMEPEYEPETVGAEADPNSGGEDETVGPTAYEPEPGTTPAAPQNPQQPTQQQPAQTVKPTPRPDIVSVGDAYMATDMSQSRAARMVKDFNTNRDVPGVRTFIAKFQRGSRDVPNIRNFFALGNPFRKMWKSIGQAYNVSPAFAYLAVRESPYFTGGNYSLVPGDGGRAIGPFQLHVAAAKEGGISAAHRSYATSSSCAAAVYLAKRVNDFWSGDTTVAILAYNQGTGGATSRMKRSIQLGGKYAYKYSEMQKYSALSKANKEYVDMFLASYFIASNMSHYKFDPSIPGARTSLPKSTFPGGGVNGIADPTCREAVKKAIGAGA